MIRADYIFQDTPDWFERGAYTDVRCKLWPFIAQLHRSIDGVDRSSLIYF